MLSVIYPLMSHALGNPPYSDSPSAVFLQRFRARREGRDGADADTGRGRARGRGGGRRGRDRYGDDEEPSTRPSEPVTLLDFVGSKIGGDTAGRFGRSGCGAVGRRATFWCMVLT